MFSSSLAKSLQYIPVGLRHSLPLFKERSPAISGSTIQRRGDSTGDWYCANQVKGIDHIRDSRLNKGLAFTMEERQSLGIYGLLASSLKTQEEQLEICRVSLGRYKDNLNKYLYLAELYDINERLFYRFLTENAEMCMPIVYTPTVGLACQKFGLAYRKPRGLFITILDKGHIFEIMKNWPDQDVRAICFTDGERILGLGDLGAYGMGIPIGKLSLYTVIAGVKPNQLLPILLDSGTDNETLLSDPLYIGIRQKRTRGDAYFEFVDEFMKAAVKRFGPNTLLQFEDFALPHATPLLQKYRDSYCTFNDDIQGTASVAVAGLLTAQRVTKKKVSESIYMFLGAGSASAGIANLLVDAMKEEGLQEKEGQSKVFMFDADGFLSSKRSKGIPDHAKQFAKDMPEETNFESLVAKVKPTVLIGASTVGGAFTPAILKLMAQNCERPIIFALSNPTHKAECTAQAAYDHTDGRCVYASGSPFPPVNYKGKTYHTGQGNNSYIFPGLSLGVIASSSHVIPEKFFLKAAQSLANYVSENDLNVGRIYPALTELRNVSLVIAVDIVKLAYEMGIALHRPKPKDLEAFVKTHIYSLNYPMSMPTYYDINLPQVQLKPIDELYPTGEVLTGVVKGKPSSKT